MNLKETARYTVPRRRVAVLQFVTTVCSVVALVVVVLNVTGKLGTKASKSSVATVDARVHDIQTSRRESAQDTCTILVTLVLGATPPNKQSQAEQFLMSVNLPTDPIFCNLYALRVTSPHKTARPPSKPPIGGSK